MALLFEKVHSPRGPRVITVFTLPLHTLTIVEEKLVTSSFFGIENSPIKKAMFWHFTLVLPPVTHIHAQAVSTAKNGTSSSTDIILRLAEDKAMANGIRWIILFRLRGMLHALCQ